MPVDHERKLAFCHIPRTGGVSICNALNLKVIEKHEPASWYRLHFPDYFLFATKREYKDRIKSALGYKDYKNKSLIEILSKRKYIGKEKKENAKLMLQPNEYFLDCEVDYLLRFEYLENDLNKMLKKIGFEKVILKKENSFKDVV